MDSTFYSTGKVAKLLGLSQATVFRAIDSGRLRAFRTPGGHHRVSRTDLEEFMRRSNVPLEVLEPRTKRVLIVEDNAAELRMMQRALSREPDLEIRTTRSGYEAGFLTKSFAPDLILLDIFLKDADGREVARLVRSDPALRKVRIVAVTGAQKERDLKDIRASGVDALIRKPVMPEALRGLIRSQLE